MEEIGDPLLFLDGFYVDANAVLAFEVLRAAVLGCSLRLDGLQFVVDPGVGDIDPILLHLLEDSAQGF